MSSVKASTLVYVTVGTLVTGAVAYAAYFDYKRRNDREFRVALKKESRKQAKAAKEEEKEQGNKDRQRLRDMVDEANAEGFPREPEDKETYFMEQVGQGEALVQSPSSANEAALCFFRALKVYPQPKELMTIYDKTVPKPILDILAMMVAYDRVVLSNDGSSASSSAGVE